MAGAYDPEVFGSAAAKYDPSVFTSKPQAKIDVSAFVNEDAISKGAREFAGQGSDALGGWSQGTLNALAGAVRGAGSIGATLARPFESGDENAQRRARIDENLRGVGAQPESLTYKGGKLGAEVAGTLAIGGVAGNAAKAALPALGVSAPAATAIGEGLATGGFRVGGATGAAGLGTRAATGAATGALSAGAVDPNDAAAGAVIGGVLPGAAQAVGRGLEVVGKGARAVTSAVSQSAAKENAIRKVGETLGDDATQAIGDIQTHYPKGAEDIPLSAAAITGNPRLAQLEQGSRLRNSDAWFEFDQKQGRAVFDNVLKATSEAGDLGERYAQRQMNWRNMWATASQNVKPKLWVARMTQFGSDLEQAAQSAESSNPAVRGLLEAVNAEMDRVGPTFSPAHLQQIRANLNGKTQPLSPDVFKAAPRDSFAVKSLIKEIDDILNVSTGGKWQKVLETYTEDSNLVRASKAAAKVRGAFVDEATGRLQGTALADDVPRITEAGLNRAMNAARLPDKSLALSTEANQRLEATLGALRDQNIVQGVKKSATAGGGSDTISNAIASGIVDKAAPNLLMQVVGAARRLGTAKTDKEIAALLSNPDELAVALNSWLKQPAAQASAPSVLGSTAARALPVAGAAMLPASSSAETELAPPAQQPNPPPEKHSAADAIEKVANASTVDDAIRGAFEVASTPSRPRPEPALVAAAEPSIAQVAEQPIQPSAAADTPAAPQQQSASGNDPIALWTGRRGAGYQTVGDADMALRTRQKVQPDLNWHIEPRGDAFVLAGYSSGREQPSGAASSSAAQWTPSGMLAVTDPDGQLRQRLAANGVKFIPARDGRVVVGTRQALDALNILQG